MQEERTTVGEEKRGRKECFFESLIWMDRMGKLIGKKAQVDAAVESARTEYQQAQRAALQEMKKCSVALAALAKVSKEQERQHGF